MLLDLRYSMRALLRNPGFAAAAILTVALGIGATTTIFSVVYNVALARLPYGSPERLVAIYTHADQMGLAHGLVGAANFRDWHEQSKSFQDMAIVRNIFNANLTGNGEPERVLGALISANLLKTLQVQPALGRSFSVEEEQVGKDHVVLLSDGLWRRRFAADPGVVGTTVTINGYPNTVVGVMGPDFRFPGREFQLWQPAVINPDDYLSHGRNWQFVVIARLNPGIDVAQAQSELATISQHLSEQYPETNTGVRAVAVLLLDDTVGGLRTSLYALFAAVSGLLVIGCANLANLLLARGVSRSVEFRVRMALGANRRRLIIQSIAEVLPIVAAGGVIGTLMAAWGVDALIPFLPAGMPRVETIRLSPVVLAFTAFTLLITALIVGLLPAFNIGRRQLAESLRESYRGSSAGPGRRRLRDVIVIGQIAIATVVLVGAGLLIRSYQQLRHVDPGFKPDGVITVSLAIPRARYAKDEQVAAFCQAILSRVQALPEITSAGMVNRLPLVGSQIGGIERENPSAAVPPSVAVDWRSATPDYFRTLQIPLIEGRSFSDADTGQFFNTPPPQSGTFVGVIDNRLARLLWPNEDPVGKRFRVGPGLPWTEIIGVVKHLQTERLDQDGRPQLYWNYLQRAQDRMVLVARTQHSPESLAASIIGAIRSIDPEQPVYDVRSMNEVVDRSLSEQWLDTVLLGGFAFAALVLTTVGIYGVISYSVAQRRREFGIRIALGAQRRDLMGVVFHQVALLAVSGAVIGLIGAGMLMRLLSGLLFNVSSTDRLTFVLALVVLASVALVAGYIPARRASKTDPLTSLN